MTDWSNNSMNKKNCWIIFAFSFFLFCGQLNAQNNFLGRIKVLAGQFDRFNTPVSLPLDGLNYNQDKGNLKLYEISKGERTAVSCQLEPGRSARLWWVLSGVTKAGKSRTFELVLGDSLSESSVIRAVPDDKKLVLQKNSKNVLQYNHAVVFPPDGIDPLYKRSGFIHPLWSPAGNVLTRIQPPDHYHHVGIWNPWTKTLFEGKNVDFWNLGEGQGTVRFAGYVSVVEGSVYGGFAVRQEHVDFQAKGADKVALNELWEVRVWNVPGVALLWDLTTTLNCASSPVELEAYRYGGGIGFRATEHWSRENVLVLTSEGKTRQEADGSRARWCDVSGGFDDSSRSGIIFMSHPANREHPEPMRIWPEDSNNGRGDMFFEFCPIRHKAWKLLPGVNYVLNYRMLVYDNNISRSTAESLWQDFASPPKVTIE